jgi:hypothetical protein
MKKLALLLGALSLVSSVAYAKEVVPAVEEVVVVEEAAPVAAAPALTITNIGQYIEVDNTSGHNYKKDKANIGEAVHFAQVVGLAYDDWTFGLMARKAWSMDTDEGIYGAGHRIELDVWKNYDNFSVGARWRQEETYDRFVARVKYNYGMFSGWVDAGYDFGNASESQNDNIYSEGMPVAVTVGPVTLGYYYEYYGYNGMSSADNGETEEEIRHQVRAMFPLYTGEKLSLSAEYRYQFANDFEVEKNAEGKEAYYENNRHIGIINANYAVTDSLSVYGYYEYDWNKYDEHDAPTKADDYYGEFCIGWNYAF